LVVGVVWPHHTNDGFPRKDDRITFFFRLFPDFSQDAGPLANTAGEAPRRNPRRVARIVRNGGSLGGLPNVCARGLT